MAFGDNVVPGWRVHKGDDGILRIALNGSSVLNVTSVDNSPVAHDVLFAMAAAPELLRGCRAAAAYLIDPASKHATNRQEAARIILDAINKAEGRGE